MNATHQFETKILFTGIMHSEAIADYIEKKLTSAKRLFSGESSGASGLFNVEVGRTTRHHRSGDVFRAEINFRGAQEQAHVVAERSDIYAALDEAKDELVRELRKARKKKVTLLKHGGLALKNMLHRFNP